MAAEEFLHGRREPRLAVAQAAVRLGVLRQEVQAAGAALRTVSLPATTRRKKNISSSGAVSSGSVARDVMTSSAGSRRLWAARACA